jgi:hypothetical protein
VAMLVDVVEIMQMPKRRVSVLVWFERVDRFYRRFPRSLYFSSLTSLVIRGVSLPALYNGKLYALPKLFAYRSTQPSFDKLKGKMVKSASEVLQNVACDGKYLKPGDREFRKILDGLSRFRIVLGSDYMRISVAKGFGLNLEILEVLFGPFDFNADQKEPRF